MICQPCAAAADARAPRSQHCTSEGGPGAACDCQHRTDLYQPLDGLAAIARAYDRLARIGEAQTARMEHFREALLTRSDQIATDLTAALPDEARAAGIHFAIDATTEE